MYIGVLKFADTCASNREIVNEPASSLMLHSNVFLSFERGILQDLYFGVGLPPFLMPFSIIDITPFKFSAVVMP